MVRLPPISGNVWFNNNDGNFIDLKEKVVLVDFWTYSCVNCLRTMPYLKEWWRKYKNNKFVIIGIHTPEFEFEKDPVKVSEAIKGLEIEWPIVLDNNYVNWNNFANKFWPAKYLTDHTGNIVYEHFGEGAYEDTELCIQKLIKNIESDITLPQITVSNPGQVCYIPTPETYCGYLRGDISNISGLIPEKEYSYSLLDDPEKNTIGLTGPFISKPEHLESKSIDSKLLLNFEASEINLVASPANYNALVQVLLDYKPLPESFRGSDVNSSGELEIKSSRMYQLLKSNIFTDGILSLQPKNGNFRAYAFTFSGCID